MYLKMRKRKPDLGSFDGRLIGSIGCSQRSLLLRSFIGSEGFSATRGTTALLLRSLLVSKGFAASRGATALPLGR